MKINWGNIYCAAFIAIVIIGWVVILRELFLLEKQMWKSYKSKYKIK